MAGETVNVLLVEDNPGDAELFQEYLSAAEAPRFRVHHRESLAGGLTRLGLGGIDVLILDLSLPDSRGINTVLRARQHAPDVPIVVLTGHDDEELAVEAVQKGAQDYLVKNRVDNGALVRSIRYAVQRHRIQHGVRLARKERETREVQALRDPVGAVLSPIPLEAFTAGLLTEDQTRLAAGSLGSILDGALGPRASAAGPALLHSFGCSLRSSGSSMPAPGTSWKSTRDASRRGSRWPIRNSVRRTRRVVCLWRWKPWGTWLRTTEDPMWPDKAGLAWFGQPVGFLRPRGPQGRVTGVARP